jgi:hypothetical protein
VTLSWLAFGILAAGAGGFAAWIYVRRELPIPRRGLLSTIRGTILVLVLLLLWDPRLPGGPRSGSGDGGWVLLDASASMSAVAPQGDTDWASALERAAELAGEGGQILLFGEVPRIVQLDSLGSVLPEESASRLTPALARAAEAGARSVHVLSDLRFDDPVEAEISSGRSPFEVEIERIGEPVRNVGIARFELPPRAESGQPLSVDVALFSEETRFASRCGRKNAWSPRSGCSPSSRVFWPRRLFACLRLVTRGGSVTACW